MKGPRWLWATTATLIAIASGSAHAGAARVALTEASQTSAAVYDEAGGLARTLWSGRRLAAGQHTIEWDGNDDAGNAVSRTGRYSVRVLSHNVRYEWQGAIGNTSEDAFGETVHRAFGPINDMAFDAQGNGFYVVGYNEQQSALHRFSVGRPGRRKVLAHDDYLRVFRYVATDGDLTYFANIGEAREPESFVMALRIADGAEHRFTAGKTVMPGQRWGNRWESVIDHEPASAKRPTGLAVQQRGNLLLVAHESSNEVRLFDKRTGEPRGRIRVTAPGDMDVAPDDSVWILCRIAGETAVVRYRIAGDTWTQVGRARGSFGNPVAIGVSPLDGTVVVADAAREQLLAFDSEGRPAWTYGRPAGYRAGGPAVTTDKLWLTGAPTYLAFARDGSFWVGDVGNFRNLHVSAERRYLEQIMYLPASYVATADPAAPGRVFSHFLEFEVDYSRPLRESWNLRRNWAAGLDGQFFGSFAGLQGVFTLRNGRTYGVVQRRGLASRDVVELTDAGLRITGQRLVAGEKLYEDGSIRFHRMLPGSLKVYMKRLASFDAAGNPAWEPPALLGGVSPLKATDPYYNDVPEVPPVNSPTYPMTMSGLVVSFNPGRSKGYHLGAFRPGREEWLWRASPAGSWDVDAQGDITSLDGRYETGNGVQYPGNVVMTSGRQIVYGYHGEAWNQGQANQWMHFLDDGLFVGQFGRPNYPFTNRAGSRPGSAGNAFSPQLVTVNGTPYLWHNDEGVHGGINRWRIAGTDGIKVVEAPITP